MRLITNLLTINLIRKYAIGAITPAIRKFMF